MAKKQLAHEPPFENRESYSKHSMIPVSGLNGCICHHNPGAVQNAHPIVVTEHGQLIIMFFLNFETLDLRARGF